MAEQQTERRRFKMHPDLLWSIIKSQAGTIEKALTEACMNSIDAGASRCEIQITETGYRVADDGKGFTSKKEIDEFFDTFGTPHKEGDARYGRFRMGRGQLFSFGRSRWYSSDFMMDVDIKAKGLEYDFKEDKRVVRGCVIQGTWYKPLTSAELIEITHSLAKLVAWAEIPIIINGKQVNKLPSQKKWQIETDEAYIDIKETGDLAVYNQGVLVNRYWSGRFGVSGLVVSKRPLNVNFARNDILVSECAVWKAIKKELDKANKEKVTKASLSDAERDGLAMSFLRGEMDYREVRSATLLLDAKKRRKRLSELENAKFLTCPGESDRLAIAEKIHESKAAYVLDKETLDRFDVKTVQELIGLIKDRVKGTWFENYYANLQEIDFQSLAQNFTGEHDFLDPKKLSPHQKALLAGFKRASEIATGRINFFDRTNGSEAKMGYRKIVPGSSDTAEMWTDGKTYIAINKSFLQSIIEGHIDFYQAAAVLLHEFCHEEPDTNTHGHTPDFFERYHDLSIGTYGGVKNSILNEIRDTIMQYYAAALTKEGYKPKPFHMKALDLDEKRLGLASNLWQVNAENALEEMPDEAIHPENWDAGTDALAPDDHEQAPVFLN